MPNRERFAVWIIAVGLLIGLVGSLFFFEQPLGINVPVFVVLVLGGLLLLATGGTIPLPVRNLWPLVLLLFFAIMVAVRDTVSLTFSNLLAIFTLGGLVIYYLPGQRFIDTESVWRHMAGLLETGIAVMIVPITTLLRAAQFFRQDRDPDAPGAARSRAVTRGLLLALPVLLVFAILLGAADAVFASYLERLWAIFQVEDLEELIGRLFVAGMLAWAAWGAFAYGLARSDLGLTPSQPDPTGDDPFATQDDDSSPSTPVSGLRLGIIEAGIVLGSVNLLFAAFVAIQFAYFFGGQQNVAVDGLTYAEYARRGFFELVTVSVLTLGLGLLLDAVTRRQRGTQETVFRALAVIVVLLTGVMLVSAWRRMSLYETVYGFTHLRIYTHVFMIWLGVLFGVYLLSLFRVRAHIFSVGLILVFAGYLITLNLINPDALITRRNLQRYAEGYELDLRYLNEMSADAAPELIAFYDTLVKKEDEQTRECVGLILRDEHRRLDRLRANALPILGSHLGRDAAWRALDPLAENLPAYNWSYFYDNCWSATPASTPRD